MPSKSVSVATVTTDENPQPSIRSVLSGLELGQAHINRSAAHGYFPAQQIEGVRNILTAARNALKGVIVHMPAHDPNVAKINDLIERIG